MRLLDRLLEWQGSAANQSCLANLGICAGSSDVYWYLATRVSLITLALSVVDNAYKAEGYLVLKLQELRA